MIPGILKTLTRADVGGANPVAISAGLISDLDFADETDSLATARATNRKIGFAQGFSWRYLQNSVFAALNTLQLASTQVRLVFAFDAATGGTFTYDPCRLVAVPIFGPFDDRAAVHIADAGESAAVGLGTWVDLGVIRGGSRIEVKANTTPDGVGAPLYVTTSLRWEVEFVNIPSDVAATLQSYASSDAKLAIEHSDGTYTMFDTIQVSSIIKPNIGLDQVVSRMATFEGAWRDITAAGGWTFPASPPDFFNGVEVTAFAAGVTEADVLTIT